MKPCFHDVLPLLSMINHHIIHHIIRHIITTYQNSSQCKLLARQNPCNSGPVGFSVKINKNYSLSLSVSVSNSLSAYTWILINWFIIFESFWVWRKITNQSAPKMPAVKRLKNLPPLQTMSNIRHIYIQPSQLVWKKMSKCIPGRELRRHNAQTTVLRGTATWWVVGTPTDETTPFLNFSKLSMEQKIYDHHFCFAIDKFRGGVIQLIGKEAFYCSIFPFFWNFICKNYRFAMPWK